MATPLRQAFLCMVFLCHGLFAGDSVWVVPFGNLDGRILLGEHEGFVQAPKEITLRALTDILQASSALEGKPLEEIKEGTEWKIRIAHKGETHEAKLRVVKTFQDSLSYGIRISLTVVGQRTIAFDFLARTCGSGSRACTRITTRKPTSGDLLGTAFNHLVLKPLERTMSQALEGNFLNAFGSAVSSQFTGPTGLLGAMVESMKDLGAARDMAKNFSLKFVQFWRAYANFLRENPSFSLEQFLKLASSGERPKLNALFRSPYGHSLKALNALLQTVIQYRKYLNGYGVQIDAKSDLDFERIGSRLVFTFEDIPVFITVLGRYPDVRLGVSMHEGQPLAEIELKETAATLEWEALGEKWASSHQHTEIDIQVRPATDLASTFENPELLFSALSKWQSLSSKMSAVPSTNAYVDLFFHLWADLSSRIANTTGNLKSTCVGFLVVLVKNWGALSSSLPAQTGNQPARIPDKSESRTD